MSVSLQRCFKLPANISLLERLSKNGHRINQWITAQSLQGHMFNDRQAEHMARLLPLLLCGEQSAQLVFNQEISRLSQLDEQQLISTLLDVEADEYRHDVALQLAAAEVANQPDFYQVQRQARRFYASLGRVECFSDHFVRIATLDTCVTHIMHAFEHSNLGKQHPFSQLCNLIKKDEAKHVYVSREHAMSLGAEQADFIDARQQVVSQLFGLLLGQQQSFEQMGVCLTQLQTKLEDKWQ